MENYTYTASYPESGDSSPRSRENEFENPPPSWDDQQQNQQNYKVKFMCSYGGKIHPRPHDNQLSYVGGETKILAVYRNVKFNFLISKLSGLCDFDNISFKYQLPGEDLDALITVMNDDDLENMMHEYDRLYKASPKPARWRIFLFPANPSSQMSFGSEEAKSEKERFVEALNSCPVQTSSPAPPQNNVDYLFGLEKGMAPPPTQQVNPVTDAATAVEEMESPKPDDRTTVSDPIQKHIQDLNRLRIEEHNIAGGGYTGGEYFVQRAPEKVPQVTIPGNGPIPAGYWPEKQITGGVYQTTTLNGEQPVYMIQAPVGAYHTPVMRPMTGPVGQGYYAVQRMPPPEIYRDQQQVYNVIQNAPPSVAAAPPSLQPQAPQYSEGYGIARPSTTGGVGMMEVGYTPVAYDNGIPRQVYYNTPGPQPTQSGTTAHFQDNGKVISKVTQASG